MKLDEGLAAGLYAASTANAARPDGMRQERPLLSSALEALSVNQAYVLAVQPISPSRRYVPSQPSSLLATRCFATLGSLSHGRVARATLTNSDRSAGKHWRYGQDSAAAQSPALHGEFRVDDLRPWRNAARPECRARHQNEAGVEVSFRQVCRQKIHKAACFKGPTSCIPKQPLLR